MTTRRKPPHAFTLVELLVVIGIIAIIIGLLLPVLAGVQARGRDVKCQANLRSIVQAMYGYAAENGGSSSTTNNRATSPRSAGKRDKKVSRASGLLPATCSRKPATLNLLAPSAPPVGRYKSRTSATPGMA